MHPLVVTGPVLLWVHWDARLALRTAGLGIRLQTVARVLMDGAAPLLCPELLWRGTGSNQGCPPGMLGGGFLQGNVRWRNKSVSKADGEYHNWLPPASGQLG